VTGPPARAGRRRGRCCQNRRVLLDDLGIGRPQLHAAAYWKRGISFDDMDAETARRYAAAVAAGRDVTDPAVLEDLSLTVGTRGA
jgi:hypothetical protein